MPHRVAAIALFIGLVFAPGGAEAQPDASPSPAASPGHHHHHHHHHGAAAGGSLKQYASESDARTACTSGSVEWMNTNSGALHPAGDPYYGKTKHGAYVCAPSSR